ncbi:tetratricopeptide repeat protein [Rheinheimera sp. NSM]|uniref:tetratricopeptide repeat protein n=1 Tax=Rheinheimera sp. NSM TaxID=3457884 RepID=UPI0040351BE1
MKASAIKLGSSLALMLMASGSFLASATTNGYKMVLIEDTPGVAALQAGQFDQGISETLASNSAEVDNFSRQMSLCVGFTKSGKLEQATGACDSAVSAAQQFHHVSNSDKREMRAYALTNRGVLRLLQNNNLAALADFKRAAELNRSDVSQHNLQRLELALNNANSGLDVAMVSAE